MSLDPLSPDEELTRELLVEQPAEERPDLVVVVMSAVHLARGVYLLRQVRELGVRTLVAVSMLDVARRRGLHVDLDALSRATGGPVVGVDPRRRHGHDDLTDAVAVALSSPVPAPDRTAPEDELAAAEERFAWVSDVVAAATTRSEARASWSDRLDRLTTAPVLGPLLFLGVMWLLFQATTTLAAPLQEALDSFFTGPVSDVATAILTALGLEDTWVEGFVVSGLIAGVGMLLTFVPLMAVMFAFLSLLEDSGYLARAAVVTDRVMRSIGLPGRAFLPLVVGFGCNVPAISGTRVLPDARHRLLTALLVPFTSCSARLTVYVLVATTFFGDNAGTVVFAMYVVSLVLVVLVGLLLRTTLIRALGNDPLVLDLPPYQLPMPRLVATSTWRRLRGFLRTASGIIVATVVVVWALSAIPAPGRSTRTTSPSVGWVQRVRPTATVVPGQLPTSRPSPVRPLNSVDLPTFGLPTSATTGVPADATTPTASEWQDGTSRGLMQRSPRCGAAPCGPARRGCRRRPPPGRRRTSRAAR